MASLDVTTSGHPVRTTAIRVTTTDIGVIIEEDGHWSIGPAGIGCCFDAHRLGGAEGALERDSDRVALAQALEGVIGRLQEVMRQLIAASARTMTDRVQQ